MTANDRTNQAGVDEAGNQQNKVLFKDIEQSSKSRIYKLWHIVNKLYIGIL